TPGSGATESASIDVERRSAERKPVGGVRLSGGVALSNQPIIYRSRLPRTATLGATRADRARNVFQKFSNRLMNSCTDFIFLKIFKGGSYTVPLLVTPNLTLFQKSPGPGH